MPVIDLTINDDVDHPLTAEKHTKSIIELCGTPPLDVNGNEIIIATDTKTMQAVRYSRALDVNSKQSNVKNTSELSESSITTTTTPTNSPILYKNLTQTRCQMPSEEQTKFDTNYKRWMQYLRSYNGFRLFAQRNYMKIQKNTFSKRNKLAVQSKLLEWWNTLSLAEKEQYARIAESKLCKPLPIQRISSRKQPHLDETSLGITNMPSSRTNSVTEPSNGTYIRNDFN